MATYNITISDLTFEELKETVLKLGDAAIAGTIETKPSVSAASVMTAPTPEVVAAPKAAPAKRSSTKKAQEPVAPLVPPVITEDEEMESVPSPFAPSQPVSTAQPTVQVAHSASVDRNIYGPFDRAKTISNIQSTVESLKTRLVDIEAVRAVINDTYASLGMNPEPMTGLPDDKMEVVYKAFYARALGILNGSIKALV